MLYEVITPPVATMLGEQEMTRLARYLSLCLIIGLHIV